jgi:peptidoglycan hydrolase FlgJ
MAAPASTAIGGDARALQALRADAARDPKAAIREAAKQFETLFMQQLMKSMRESTMASGMLENSGTKMGTEMLDGQWATKMSGLPGGLADAIARQLERQMANTVPPAAAQAAAPAAAAAGAPKTDAVVLSTGQQAFVQQHQAAAQAAATGSGVPAAFMVAQAAHESGFGRSEIRNADGSSSHNLFGIKATAGWKGKVAEITTTEVVDGQAQKVRAKFRAYDSYAESFSDYARMLKESPRYQQVLANAQSAQGFAQGLQRAGYATDPAYAAKLTRVINSTLRMQRAVT